MRHNLVYYDTFWWNIVLQQLPWQHAAQWWYRYEVVIAPILSFISGTQKRNWKIPLARSWMSVVFLSEDKNVFQREYNNTYIILFACYMVINTTVPLRFHVFQAISKTEVTCLLKSHSNTEHWIQTTLFCVMNIFSYTFITYLFFFLEIDCNHLQKLPAKTGTLLCHNRWMNWNVPWQREGTYKRDSYIFCLNFSMLTCINTIFMGLLISQHSVETSYCIYTQRRKRKRRNLS